MNVLIIGGSSGLGLELGKVFAGDYYEVFITGRKDHRQPGLKFVRLEINSTGELSDDLNRIVKLSAPIDTFIYSAGFYQDGLIGDLKDRDIKAMINIGLTVPAMLLKRILRKQDNLDGFIAISSNSATIPRLREPVYAAVKAGLEMLARSVSLDARIKKTLVVAPAGMDTKFWKGRPRKGNLLYPKWIADRIFDLYGGKFKYKQVYILREPARVEIIDER